MATGPGAAGPDDSVPDTAPGGAGGEAPAASPVRTVVASLRPEKAPAGRGGRRLRLQQALAAEAEGEAGPLEDAGRGREAGPGARPLPAVCATPLRSMWRAEKAALYCDEVLRGAKVRARRRRGAMRPRSGSRVAVRRLRAPVFLSGHGPRCTWMPSRAAAARGTP